MSFCLSPPISKFKFSITRNDIVVYRHVVIREIITRLNWIQQDPKFLDAVLLLVVGNQIMFLLSSLHYLLTAKSWAWERRKWGKIQSPEARHAPYRLWRLDGGTLLSSETKKLISVPIIHLSSILGFIREIQFPSDGFLLIEETNFLHRWNRCLIMGNRIHSFWNRMRDVRWKY